MTTTKWRLYAYDLWGNEEDGFEVNDVFHTADVVDLEEGEGLLDKAKALGVIKHSVEEDDHGYSENVVYLVSGRTGQPLGEFRKEE